MRRLLVVLTVPAVLAALAIPALAATRTVKVGDNWFVRDSDGTPTVTVKKNDTVKWRFVGDSPHNVTVTSGPVKFKSKNMDSGSYSKKVKRAGLYRIICTIHDGQKMKLRVKSK